MDLIDLLMKLGTPSGALIGLWIGYRALQRVAIWLRDELVIPFRDAHLGMVGTLRETAKRNADCQEQQTRLWESMDRKLDSLHCRNGVAEQP